MKKHSILAITGCVSIGSSQSLKEDVFEGETVKVDETNPFVNGKWLEIKV
ncbi:hypothetical protein ACFFHM_09040 [Halalkalibacter kiskunsagensis]|uniref:Uncharacterized protein n=1 Tax=Halalkalibacter kiskunsagensis TaxID=1548599 RepID=A0ABV6KCG5_9BACI